MTRQVYFDKKSRVVSALRERIERGELLPGERLPGEHELAATFDVSRGTLREALAELQRSNHIATQGGVGSIVTYDSVPLRQDIGWAKALAAADIQVVTELLGIERVERPELVDSLGHSRFVLVKRRRRTAQGPAVSLERAFIPACEGLAELPERGLVAGSLTATLATHGYRAANGRQWIGAEGLDEQAAALLERSSGTVFLKAVRESFDAKGRFMERVESLLDPEHFQLHLTFGPTR